MQGKGFNRNTAKNRKYKMNMAIKKHGLFIFIDKKYKKF